MIVTDMPVESLVPYARNPRNNTAAIDAVKASIAEFGFRQPIVVDEKMVVIVGHTRLEAAKALGLKTVPVHVAEGLTPAQAKAYRIMDNRSHENAQWDDELLRLEFGDLKLDDFDLALTGFVSDELDKLLGAVAGLLVPNLVGTALVMIGVPVPLGVIATFSLATAAAGFVLPDLLLRDEAEKRIGHLYPRIAVTAEMAAERPDLKPLVGQELTVVAWLWARTVKSPNPAFANVDVPLASTFMLSTKVGKETYVEHVIEGDTYRFTVKEIGRASCRERVSSPV